ncbi:uncharacterized protein LOC135346235 [Halichondria panicea]|uniref:uncharacterized protein LOC135346235 n=1 Tax=Halichondria panicea TaxID=6063 RepID=UPI00312B8614
MEQQQQTRHLEILMTSLMSRIERRLISLENRVISLESSSSFSPWHRSSSRRTLSYEDMMLPEDSPDYELIPKPRVRSFPARKKKISLFNAVCVQCCERFRAQENSPCSCIYHYGELKFVRENKYVLTCCEVPVKSRGLVWRVPGCRQGWHTPKQHTNYTYVGYYLYMNTLLLDAQEIWLSVDILDPVSQACEWGQVGLSAQGVVYVIVGYSREQPLVYKEFSFCQLQECKSQNSDIIRKCSDNGWALSVSLQSAKTVAKSITVSLKAAGYKSALVKRLQLVLSGEKFKPGSIETLSDPTPPVAKVDYPVSEDMMRGPVLEPGVDHSLGRRNNYTTHKNDPEFPISLTQMECVTVNSSLLRMANGKWNNLFTTTFMVSNSSPTDILVRDMYTEYKSKGGQWNRCDSNWIAVNGSREFIEKCCFPVVQRSDLVLSLRAAIAVAGDLAVNGEDRQRAHFSLPQPLHLRVVCVCDSGSASIRVEQGNPPLQLVTREQREIDWSEELVLYMTADDVHSLRRTEAALFYNDEGVLMFRACPYGIETEEILLSPAALMSAAYYAKRYHRGEQELLRRENYGSSVRVYAMVDLELGVPYSLKVALNTVSSHSISYYRLPRDAYTSSRLSVHPHTLPVNGTTTITWSLSRASKNDRICVFTKFGSYRLSEVINEQGMTDGTQQLRVPGDAGLYELRYYPAWLAPRNSSCQHHSFIIKTSLTVTE